MILLLLLVTTIPTLLYVVMLWWLDKYEKESWWLFLSAFAYGCLPAVILSIILELLIEMPFAGIGGDTEPLGMVLVAPFVEELIKGLAVLLIFLIFRREFDGVLDGIIYGAVIGFGFAMVENALYFVDTAMDLGVIVLRTVPFGWNHAVFTALTGAGLGLARQSKHRWLWLLLFPLSLGIGIFFHTVHNFSVGTGECLGVILALTSDWGGIIVLLVVAILTWGQEKRLIRQELTEEVANGLLAAADLQALLYLSRRIGARLWTWRHKGWQAFRLLGRFFYLATELAFRKHHLRRGTADPSWTEEVQTLRLQIWKIRQQILAVESVR